MRAVKRSTATATVLTLAAAIVLALAGPSAGGAARDASTSHDLHVDLAEWAVVPSRGLVAAGRLHLTVQNYGRLGHELAIIPIRRWGDRLTVRHGRAVGTAVASPVVVAPGQSRSIAVDLPPGAYVLLDDIRGRYDLGAAVSILAR
jgi:hypothetical protein